MDKLVKERIIFQNYDLEEYEKDYRNEYGEDEDFSEDVMWDCIYDLLDDEFNFAFSDLKSHFKNKVIAFGSIGRWDGVYDGGKVFDDFESAYWQMVKDCDYVKIYDENGHLFVHCSHHDGSCTFEIKELTTKGEEYLDRWEWNFNDKRSERECHNQIVKHYSKIPNFAHKVYGCKAREYVKPTKEEVDKKLFNKARSFYS